MKCEKCNEEFYPPHNLYGCLVCDMKLCYDCKITHDEECEEADFEELTEELLSNAEKEARKELSQS